MSAYDEFDIYGNPIGFIPDDIKKGDVVSYIDARSKKVKHGSITIYVKLVGIWDGEKVEFTDKDKTVVKTINWLKLEK